MPFIAVISITWGLQSQTPPAGVLFVQTGQTTAQRQREKRFVGELRLVLDNLRVSEWRPAKAGFADQSLARQIVHIRRLLKRRPALAAVWLSQPTPQLLLLHLVSVSTGRALVRLVESKAGRGSEAKLALAARELLGTAYLFAKPAQRRHAALARVVERVRERVRKRVVRRVKPPSPLSIGVASLFQVGVWGQSTGLTMGAGLSLDAEMGLGRRWKARLRLDVLARPLGVVKSARVEGVGVEPGLEVGPGWTWGKSQLLVVAGLRVGWNQLWLRPEVGQDLTHSWTELQLTLGMELRWRLSDRVAFLVGLGMQVTPNRQRFLGDSSGHVFLTTPWLRAGLNLGVRFFP